MAVLGIYEGHNAGAAVISEADGSIVAAVEEERFSRIKNHDARDPNLPGPLNSVKWCLESTSEPITTIAVGLEEPQVLQRRALNNFAAALARGESQRLHRAAELGVDTFDLLGMPARTQAARVAKALVTIDEAGLDYRDKSVDFVDHHHCHAASFLISPVEGALVITLDGKGDDLSGSVWLGRAERLDLVLEIPTEDSLGHLYSAATTACGLRPQRDEGKLTAIAASGQLHERLYHQLGKVVWFDAVAGAPVSLLSQGIVQGPYPDRIPSYHNAALMALTDGIDPPDVAKTVQQVLEDVVVSLVRHHLTRSGDTELAVAGGVFANVSLNKRIADTCGIERLHVHPGMTDSGIALGAAAAVYTRIHCRRPQPLTRIDLGPSYGDAAALTAFRQQGYRVVEGNQPAEARLAAALASGAVVARFAGGCEYGPRALGHRSVLAPATDRAVCRSLNERLERSQIMPFAPVTLDADASRFFAGLSTVPQPTRSMTTAVGCTGAARAAFPAAVHMDGTARPQVVFPRENPGLALLLQEYRNRSGVPALINTSFNMHDEPIVCTPVDAARSARRAGISVVQVGDHVCFHSTCTDDYLAQ